MALQFNNYSVNLLGLNTKADPKMLQPGELVTLENGVFTKAGTIQKRNGYQLLNNQYITDQQTYTSFSSGESLTAINNQLLMLDNGNSYSYASADNFWIPNGYTSPCNISEIPIVNNAYNQYTGDSALLNNVIVYAWEETINSINYVKYSVQDSTSGTFYFNDVILSANATKPKVIAFGSFLFIYYLYQPSSQVNLKVVQINPLNPYTLGTTATVSSTVNTTYQNYDVVQASIGMFLVFNTTSNNMNMLYLSQSLIIQPYDGYHASYTISEYSNGCLSALVNNDTGNIHIAYDGYSSMGVRGIGFTSMFQPLYSVTSIDAITGCRNITGYFNSDTQVTWYYEQPDAYEINNYIKQNTITSSGSVGTASVFLRSVGLASKAFTYNGIGYVNVAYQGMPTTTTVGSYTGQQGVNLQQTYFLMSEKGALIGKYLPYTSGGLTSKNVLPQVYQASTGVFEWVGGQIGNVQINNNTFQSTIGLTRFSISYVDSSKYQYTQLGNQIFMAGGIISNYDGYAFTETGFAVYPEYVQASHSSSGGSIGIGDFSYQFVYRWIDNQGVVHNSYPSVPIVVTVSSGSSNSITLIIPTLRITNKKNVTIEIYRTTANGSIPYRVTSPSTPLLNDLTVDTVSYTDTLDDFTIAGNEILYTIGGVLGNDSVPTASLSIVYNNRVWIAGMEDPNLLWYSKKFTPGQDIGFSTGLTFRLPEQGGSITGLAVMDGKLVIFKENLIYYLIGYGPDNTGANSDLSAATLIPADAGCIEPRSIVVARDGIFFQSSKGIYLLGRDLFTKYIGAPVEQFNSLDITSATLVEDVNEVRFTTSTGTTLVYNYYFGLWSTFTNQPAVSALMWNGQFCYLTANGKTFKEAPGVFTDNLQPIQMNLSTGYISFAGLQGFQRIAQINVLGNYYSPHWLYITAEYDNLGVPSETAIFNTTNSLDIQYWGSDAYWGSNSYWGNSDTDYEFKFIPQVQQCRAIRLTFYDVDGLNPGQAFSINNITFRVGINTGLNRMPVDKQV